MLVLGLNVNHDASACLIRDGKIVCAIQQERLTKIKHDGSPNYSDSSAIQYCLDYDGATIDDVSLIVSNVQSLSYGGCGMAIPLRAKSFSIFDPFDERHMFISHHLAHAYSAFSPSGFKSAEVLVVDAVGSHTPDGRDYCMTGPQMQAFLRGSEPEQVFSECVSLYKFDNYNYHLHSRDFISSPGLESVYCGGIGAAWAVVSNYIFHDSHAGGKVMGLAPYGDADKLGHFKIIELDNDKYIVHNNWQWQFNEPGLHNGQQHLAAKIQKESEETLLMLARKLHSWSGEKNLCYAGGVALNCAINTRLVLNSGFKNLFVQPAAGDAGIAVGCAYFGWSKLSGRNCNVTQTSDFLGRKYSKEEIERALKKYRMIVYSKPNNLIELIANEISRGKVVGWFEGASEFGPRALGHRSIFADPTNPSIKDRINLEIKHRESFRPFAPVCITEETTKYFEYEFESPFMTLINVVRKEWRNHLPAITHIDGTARIQTVGQIQHPRLYHLLRTFEKLKGVPILLNTSLNLKASTIVETPEDAINCLISSKLDVMVIEDWLVEKIDIEKNNFSELIPYLLPSTSIIAERSGLQSVYGAFGISEVAHLTERQWMALQLIDGNRKVKDLATSSQFSYEEWASFLKDMEKKDLIRFGIAT